MCGELFISHVHNVLQVNAILAHVLGVPLLIYTCYGTNFHLLGSIAVWPLINTISSHAVKVCVNSIGLIVEVVFVQLGHTWSGSEDDIVL